MPLRGCGRGCLVGDGGDDCPGGVGLESEIIARGGCIFTAVFAQEFLYLSGFGVSHTLFYDPAAAVFASHHRYPVRVFDLFFDKSFCPWISFCHQVTDFVYERGDGFWKFGLKGLRD
jgi:hypothetical protein